MLSESMDNLSSRKLNQQSSREPQSAGGDATRARSIVSQQLGRQLSVFCGRIPRLPGAAMRLAEHAG